VKRLWTADAKEDWESALASYDAVIARQGVARLADLERWYSDQLPASIGGRAHAHISHAELVKVTEWKMARGIWRVRNLALVRGNSPSTVETISTKALAEAPHPTAPIATLAELAGVGPATASAVAAAAAPDLYPFFDELVADQIPGLGKVAYTLGYYARYAIALRERAEALGRPWTPVLVERALWAHAGGKAGARESRKASA
jgi:hypothetical protein